VADFLNKNMGTALQVLVAGAAVAGAILTATLVKGLADAVVGAVRLGLAFAGVALPVLGVLAAIALLIGGAFLLKKAYDENLLGIRDRFQQFQADLLDIQVAWLKFQQLVLRAKGDPDAAGRLVNEIDALQTQSKAIRDNPRDPFSPEAQQVGQQVDGFIAGIAGLTQQFKDGFPGLVNAIRTGDFSGLNTPPTLPQRDERAAANGFAAGTPIQVNIVNPVIANLVDAKEAGKAAAAEVVAAIESAANRAAVVAPAHLLNHPH
jgi:hypothetical protein